MVRYMPLNIAQALVRLDNQLGQLDNWLEQLGNGLDNCFNHVDQQMDQLQASSKTIRITKCNQACVADELEPLLKTVHLEQDLEMIILNFADLSFLGFRSWSCVSHSKLWGFEPSDTRKTSTSNWNSATRL
jgi:hypothetical protein